MTSVTSVAIMSPAISRLSPLMRFDPQNFGPIFGPLVAAAPLNELGPARPDRAAAAKLGGRSVEAAFAPHAVVDRQMADACVAGLWLMCDFLDESHAISQDIDTPSGSYWHAILHRREPDYSNAKYWFRQVGRHPIFESLATAARQIADEADASDAVSALLQPASLGPVPLRRSLRRRPARPSRGRRVLPARAAARMPAAFWILLRAGDWSLVICRKRPHGVVLKKWCRPTRWGVCARSIIWT